MFHINFIHHSKIKIICEGKTDPQHLYNYLRNTKEFNIREFEIISFEKHLSSFSKPLKLSGGTGDLSNFIKLYSKIDKSSITPKYPTILFVDNDTAGKSVFNTAKKTYPDYKEIELSTLNMRVAKFYKNIFIVQFKENYSGIEHLYNHEYMAIKINGKSLSTSNEKINEDKEYGKNVFFHKVIKPLGSKVDFSNFKILFLCFIEIYKLTNN